ncbi:MAG: adenylate kinase [Spirochaetes bacterium]|nr:adenylate kinase [Spirochaetota bacterium]
MIIVLLGAPGTGKGTQAQFLARRFDLEAISTGDILRQEIKNGTSLGKKAEKFVTSGGLVPDDIIIDMIRGRIDGPENRSRTRTGVIFDGFPRTLSQAKALEKMLSSLGSGIDRAIYFHMPEERIIERLSGRRVCTDCGETYHVVYNPPKEVGVCGKCGGALYQREDDKPEIIRQRLQTYNRDTAPIIDYYSKKDYYLQVDAYDDIDRIKEKITRVLGG